MDEKEGGPSVFPLSVTFGCFSPWVVEVVWEGMVAVGGFGRGRFSCVCSLCGVCLFSLLVSLSVFCC